MELTNKKLVLCNVTQQFKAKAHTFLVTLFPCFPSSSESIFELRLSVMARRQIIKSTPKAFKNIFRPKPVRAYRAHPTRKPASPAPPNLTIAQRIARQSRLRREVREKKRYRPGSMTSITLRNR